MQSRPNSATASSRAAVPLTGTTAKTQASLDAGSVIALAYAQEWHRRAGDLKVPSSGIIRRALLLYCAHLEQAAANTSSASSEAHAVRRACKVLPPADAAEATRNALERLHGADIAQPLPPFEVVRDGPQAVAERAAFHAHLGRALPRMR